MRRTTSSILLLLGSIATASCMKKVNDNETISSDTISPVMNADIVAMDPDKPLAQAIAVSGDRVIAIGHYEKFYNLEGRTVVPGFFEYRDLIT